MRSLYEKISGTLDTIDFNIIWPEFRRYNFALYNKDWIYLKDTVIPHDIRFRGNTAIEFDGENLAIWNVNDPINANTDMMTCGIVHEMFHAFQRSKGEERYPNDLLILDYPDNLENYKLRYMENLLLSKAILSDDTEFKKDCLTKVIYSRKLRESLIGDIIKQEYYVETLEGLAEYAGCLALKQISQDKYNNLINYYSDELEKINNNFFYIRRSAYNTGVVFFILLSETGFELYHDISKSTDSLFDIISEGYNPAKPNINVDEKLLAEMAEKNLIAKKSQIEEFLLTHTDRVDGDFTICGYDPVNMIKLEDMYLCSHFIMLREPNKEQPQFIHGPLLLRLFDNSTNRVKYYIR